MFKALLIALVLVLLSGSGAHAEPVSLLITAIGTALKAGGIVALLIKTAFSLALSAGLSLIQQARARRAARKENNTRSGVTLQVQMGDALPRSYLIGTRATAGQRFYIGYWGEADKTPNAYITDCVVVSCLPSRNGSQGLEGISVGKRICTVLWDQPHPDGRGYPLKELRDGNTDYGWVKYLDGTQTAADPFLISKFGNHSEHPYLPSMIGRGCQIVILTTRHNYDFFNNQLQQGVYQPKPMRIYSLRKDSTAGGNGACRWEDPTTWESSDNLADLAYTVARGLYYRGRWVHGGRNFSTYRLPPSAWMAAANVCDIDIGGRRQYRGGLEVFVDSQPIDVIEDLRVGCSGRFAEVGGQLKLLCGAPGAPVYSFTDESIVVTQDQGFEPFASVSSTHNTITGVYPEPAQLWATKDAPEYSVPALLIRDDGQKLPIGMEYDAVPFSAQVQALMKTDLEESQRWRIHEAFFGPEARALEPNDPIAYTSERNSYSNKLFIVVRATPSDGLKTRVTFKEWEPSDYQPPSVIIPPVVGPVGSLPKPPQPMYGWAVAPAIIQNAAGTSQRPSIRVSCAPDQDGVQSVWVKVRRALDHVIVFDSDATRYADPFSWVLNGTFAPNADYEVSGQFISDINPNQLVSAWLPVTTPNVLISTSDLFDSVITATKIADGAVSANKLMDQAVTALKLADQAVSTAKLQVGAVTQEIVANGAIIADKIANGAIEAAKFAAGIQPVTIIASGPLPVVKSTDTINYMGELYTWNGTAYTKPETGIADGSVTAAKLADAAVTAAKLASQAVTNDKIAANSIYGTVIAAGAITARELVLTDFTNIYPDFDFAVPSLYSSPDGGAIIFTATSNAIGGKNALGLAVNAAATSARSQAFPIQQGMEYLFEAAYGMAAAAAGAGSIEVALELYSLSAGGGMNLLRAISLGLRTDTVWTAARGSVSIVAAAAERRAVLVVKRSAGGANTGYVSGPMLRLKNNANLIVDGAIIASKLAVGAVTADAIAANAITAAKIVAGAISADKIQANSITARELLLTDVTNFYPDPNFDSPNFYSSPDGGVITFGGTSTVGMGTRYLLLNNPAADVTARSEWFPVQNNAEFYVDVVYGISTGSGTGTTEAFIELYSVSATGVMTLTRSVSLGVKVNLVWTTRSTLNLTTTTAEKRAVLVFKRYAGGATVALISAPTIRLKNNANLIVDGAITTGKLDALAVTAEKIAALAITAGKIAANAVTATEIAANAITAAKIAANTITGDKMVANSISARELLITDFTNLIQNWDFADMTSPDMNAVWVFTGGIFTGSGTGTQSFWNYTAGAETNANQLVMDRPDFATGTAATDLFILSQNPIPVTAGEILAWEIQVRTNGTAATAGLYYRLNWYNAAGVGIGSGSAGYTDAISNGPVPSQYGVARSGKVTVPAAARYCRVQIYHYRTNTATRYFIFDRISLRRANAGSLIVDGSITAGMIAANSITADKMNVTSLAAISAVLGNVNIENAIIGNLQVGTSNIAPGAVTSYFTANGGSSSGFSGFNLIIDHGLGSPTVKLEAKTLLSLASGTTGTAIYLTNVTDGTNLETSSITASNSYTFFTSVAFNPPAGRASTTVRMETNVSPNSNAANRFMFAYVFKK